MLPESRYVPWEIVEPESGWTANGVQCGRPVWRLWCAAPNHWDLEEGAEPRAVFRSLVFEVAPPLARKSGPGFPAVFRSTRMANEPFSVPAVAAAVPRSIGTARTDKTAPLTARA